MVSRSSVEKITCVCGGNYLKVVLAIKKAEGMDKSYLIIYLVSRRFLLLLFFCFFVVVVFQEQPTMGSVLWLYFHTLYTFYRPSPN